MKCTHTPHTHTHAVFTHQLLLDDLDTVLSLFLLLLRCGQSILDLLRLATIELSRDALHME